MFRLPLFRIRAFTFGTLSTFLSAVARGGLMFMLIIWLQGIWLPLHGYDFTETPLRAGIYMLPLTLGMLVAGPTSGYLSDRFGARPFATGGMLGAALSFVLLLLLPIDFSYPVFAAMLFLNGVSMGMFASPNRAAVMNSLPPGDRGAGGGMNQTFQNSAQVLSVGIFFTLMIVGLSARCPTRCRRACRPTASPPATAHRVARTPAGVDSVRRVPRLQPDPAARRRARARGAAGGAARPRSTGRAFFPQLISGPFSDGLHEAFAFAIVACLIAAAASLMRGGKYHHDDGTRRSCTGCEATRGGTSQRGCRHGRRARRRDQSTPHPRGAACALSGTDSRRSPGRDEQTVVIDPFGDMSGARRSRGMQFDYPPIEGVSADLLLVTHEHLDHNARRGDRRRARDPALDRRASSSRPSARSSAIASEHDESAGTERGPNTIFVFSLDGLRVCHFGDFGQSALRDEQAAAIGAGRPAVHPRRRRADDRRRAGRGDRRADDTALGRADALPHAAHRLPRDRRRVPGGLGAGRAAAERAASTPRSCRAPAGPWWLSLRRRERGVESDDSG